MLNNGLSFAELDKAVRNLGFSTGPFQLADLVRVLQTHDHRASSHAALFLFFCHQKVDLFFFSLHILHSGWSQTLMCRVRFSMGSQLWPAQ